MTQLSDNARVVDVASVLTAREWTMTMRSVAGRRLRAVVLSGVVEVGSKVADDYASAIVGALAEALSKEPK